jgi:hypothetical protein
MQIEEGKFYKNRAGVKVGPMKRVNWACNSSFVWRDNHGQFYKHNGCFYFNTVGPYDLIEEWEEPAAPPPATEADEGWGPWKSGMMPFTPTDGIKMDYREERINGVWRWQSRPSKPVVKESFIFTENGQFTNCCERTTTNTHKISFNTIDGVVDCSSVKMEPL